MRCSNCGAEYESDLAKCPYCDYINVNVAEKEYMQKLDKIKADLEEVKNEPAKALKKGFKSGTHVVIRTLAILVGVVLLFTGLVIFALRNTPESRKHDDFYLAYRLLKTECLQEAYDSRDIDKMADIYDTAYSYDKVDLYGIPHYETSYASSCYKKLMSGLKQLDERSLKKKEAEEMTYCCFYFYYKAYGEDGAEVFDSIRENEILPVITDRLGFSIEDMEGFKDKVSSAYGVSRKDVYIVTKKYFKQYH